MFGGSTDYEDFYKEHGSFLIGTTIDKYAYLSMRFRPALLPKEHVISYSSLDSVNDINNIKNQLIRETLKFKNVKSFIEFFSFSDIPSRTGLGGSSSYCVGLLHLINKLYGIADDKQTLANDAIQIERKILKESGGIQDQLWASYGGFKNIEIKQNGNILVKNMPITDEFKTCIENSILLIYTNTQRTQNEIAKSHENKNKTEILSIAKEAYTYFIKEDLKSIGNLLYESWKLKSSISNLISNDNVNYLISKIMSYGAYGAKLLGSGGGGFIMVISNENVKKKLIKEFKNYILDINFENNGVTQIYP